MNIKELPPCTNEKVPSPESPLNHLCQIQTRFNDFDMLGHLNNAVYLEFMDMGKVKYFEHILGAPLDPNGTAAVIVNINVSFYAPTFQSENIGVLTGCRSISHRSFTLEQRVINIDTGDVKCVATTVMASFDRNTLTSPELNPTWATALENSRKS